MVIKKIADALTSIPNLRVYHYWRPKMQAPFCVWAEDGESSSLEANNHKKEQAIGGAIDYFTKLEFDEQIDNIQHALNNIENVAWRLNSVQYEEDTNLIHYEWRFTILGKMGL